MPKLKSALIQQLFFLVALVVELLEIAHYLINMAHHREGMGIFLNNGGQAGHLGLIDDADQNADLLA